MHAFWEALEWLANTILFVWVRYKLHRRLLASNLHLVVFFLGAAASGSVWTGLLGVTLQETDVCVCSIACAAVRKCHVSCSNFVQGM
jgi:hypothetical protein